MNWSIHQKIAQQALRLEILDITAVNDILAEVGARAGEESEIGLELWIGPAKLNKEQLKAVLNEVGESAEQMHDSQWWADDQSIARKLDADGAWFLLDGTRQASDLQSQLELRAKASSDSAPFEEVTTANMEEGLNDVTDADDTDAGQSEKGAESGFDMAFDRTELHRLPTTAEERIQMSDRYQLGAELGRGGGGRVVVATDRRLNRKVAMKLHRPSGRDKKRALRRFVAEAQAACQLEHPNILPLYDVGILADGRVYYTMSLVEQRSLEDVLDGLRAGDPDYVDVYPLNRLLAILKQVSQAIDYAHDRGVIHRDLKPANIMIGEFGEVLLMDWGLAQVGEGGDVRTELSEQGEDVVDPGQTLGSPAYMPPEQARGQLDEIDARSDVYALGAILYEMLVLVPPFDRGHPVQTLWSVIESDLVLPRKRHDHGLWEVPRGLEEICVQALARDKEERFASAGEFVRALEEFSQAVPQRRAERQLEVGRKAAARYRNNQRRIGALKAEINELIEAIEPWEPIEKKRHLWGLEDDCRLLAIDRARAFGEAVTGFQRALAHAANFEPARQELAELYWERYCEAEAIGDEFEQIYFGALLAETEEPSYVKRLSRQVALRVESEPSGAKATLFPLHEIDRRLVVTDERYLGNTPVSVPELEVGSYLVVLEAGDGSVIRAPLYARRGEAVEMRICLPQQKEVSSDFVFVPGGPCFVGGDPDAINPRKRRRVEVGSFYCARLPVTFRDYLAFLDDLGEASAADHIPRRAPGESMLVAFDEQTQRWQPAPYYSRNVALQDQSQEQWWRNPVVGITVEDARAYCRWKSDRDGRVYRLPTENEWEKAGRGVDGRLFPWGNQFDATFCKMQQSRPQLSQPEPVGAFVDDVSAYGIRDLSGGVHEWCDSEHAPQGQSAIRGGAWNQGKRACRLASVRYLSNDQQSRSIGMRLVVDASFERGWAGTKRTVRPDAV